MVSPARYKTLVDTVIRPAEGLIVFEVEFTERYPKFQAGQFFQLAVENYQSAAHWPESRPFSVASSHDPESKKIRFVVSIGGRFTQQLYDELSPGMILSLKGPFGSFAVDEIMATPSVVVAGGTGIAPFMGLFEKLTKTDLTSDKVPYIFYGARSKARLLFAEQLLELENLKRIKLCLLLEETEGLSDIGQGAINFEYISQWVTAPADYKYFLCGPKIMVDKISSQLHSGCAIPQENIVTDDWV